MGREDTLHIQGDSTLCVDKVEEEPAAGKLIPLTWKTPKPEALEVAVPMKDSAPGPVKIMIRQYGLEKPDTLNLTAYAEAASLTHLTLSAGDSNAELTGTRLDEVAKASLDGITWSPAALTRVENSDRLAMSAQGSTANLEPGNRYFASVHLRDGRELRTPVIVDSPRPQITLLSKGTQDPASDASSPVQLGSPDDLPVQKRLIFFLKSKTPANFPRTEKIEVSAVDGSFHTTLSLADGSLMLEDSKTALGVVEPLSRFGLSAFGPVEARAVSADDVAGDWLPLGTLVRLPGFKELHCPHAVSRPCTLLGSNLFLAASIAATPEFENPTDVPPDFTGTQLSVPHPEGDVLYLKLRDDPATVQTLALPVMPLAPWAMAPPKGQPPEESQPQAEPAGTPESHPTGPRSEPAAPAPGTSAKAQTKG